MLKNDPKNSARADLSSFFDGFSYVFFSQPEEDGIVRCWTKEDGYRSHMVELDGIGKEIGPLMNKAIELIKKK